MPDGPNPVEFFQKRPHDKRVEVSMKGKHRLTIGYLLTAALVAVSGLLGLYGTQKIVGLLDGKDEQLRSVVMAASYLSIEAKDAEADLTMYLLLGDEKLRNDYLSHVAELRHRANLLKSNLRVQVAAATRTLNSIESEVVQAMASGEALLDSFDSDMKTSGSFLVSDHTELMRAFLEHTSNIRRYALRLAEIQTDFLNRQASITASLQLASYSKRLQGHLLAYLLSQDKKDRGKVLDRYQSAWEMISILDDRLEDPSSRKILGDIKERLEQLMSLAQTLLEINDSGELSKRPITQVDYDRLVRKISSLTDAISTDALGIARLNVAMEIGPKQEALDSARHIQLVILVVTVIPVILAFVLWQIANRETIELDKSKSRLSALNDELTLANQSLEREILEHEKAEEEKSRLIIDLQNALAQVKTLTGLIPICSSCKKIRDDQGYWHQVEIYVREHTQAEFSHGICPDCLKKLYPEFADDILNSEKKDQK